MKTLLIIIIFFSAADLSSAQESFTLNQAIDAALEHNYNVQISNIEAEKAQNKTTRGNAGQLPSLAITGGVNGAYSDVELVPGSFFQNFLDPQGDQQRQSPPRVTFDGVTSMEIHSALAAQYVIYDGMKGRLRYKLLETESRLADIQHKSEMENTVLSVTRQYVQVVSLQKSICLKELVLEQNRERYQTIETRRGYGLASEQERLQALADLQSDSTEFRNLKYRYENAYKELHVLIGWERRELIYLDEEVQHPDSLQYEELMRILMENNTALHVMQRRIDHAELEVKVAKAEFMPTLTASAQYGYNYQSASDGQFETQEQMGFMGGVSVKIPVFAGGRNRIVSQNARHTVRQEQLRYEEARHQLCTRFDNTWQQYLYLENQLTTEQSTLEVYERNYERAKNAFERGLITGVELRAAQLSLAEAQLRISDTQFQLILAQTTLQYLSGRLLPR